MLARDRDGGGDVRRGAGHDDADRLDLVDRSIRGVAPAVRPAEQDLALDLPAEARSEASVTEGYAVGRLGRESLGVRHAPTLLR